VVVTSNENTIELIGVYGSDKAHALSAWTSTSRELNEEKEARIPSLIRMLMSAGHHTPFEKSSLHFLVTAEVASHIHLLKHRIGVSINGESARYKELKEDKFYVPSDWPHEEQERLEAHCLECFDKYHNTLNRLTPILGRARAKESARFYLPYSTQLTFDVMFNFRSFMHFLSLRYKPTAQKEISEIAERMLTLVEETKLFEHSLKAFKDYDIDKPNITKYELECLKALLSGDKEESIRLTEIIQEHPEMSRREKEETKILKYLFDDCD
jgi:flavin-dependent thymidylate synthase